MAFALCKTTSVEVLVERCLIDLSRTTSSVGCSVLHVLSTPGAASYRSQ